MALQSNGQISIADICGVNGLNIGFNPPARSLSELALLANTSSLPYANRAKPSLFDWYSYNPVTTPTSIALTLGVVAQNSVSFTWDTHIGQDGFVVTGYRVFQNGVLHADNIASNINSFNANSLIVNTNYDFYVQAFNAGGTNKNSNTVSAYTPDTTPPNAFTVSSIIQTSTSIDISWLRNGDNVAVVYYEIYKNGIFVGRRDEIIKSYSDTGLTPSTSYQYYIIAFDNAGNSTKSNTLTVSTLAIQSFSIALNYFDQEPITGATNANFTTARTTASAIVSELGFFDYEFQATFTHNMSRLYFTFNTSSITAGVLTASIRIYINSVFYTTGYFGSTQNFVIVKTFSQKTASYVYQVADFNLGIDSNSVVISNIVSFASGMKNYVDIPLNSTGIAQIINNSSLSMCILQYDNDFLNIATTSVNDKTGGMILDMDKVSLIYTK